jgi:hypothetical protein
MSTKSQIGNRLPNFLILGTAKAGTSSLYHYLKQHPDVYLSPKEELNFFAHAGRDLNFRGPGDLGYLRPNYLVENYEDYCDQFTGVNLESAIGEFSPHNLYCSQAPALIKRYVSHPKMIAILRNPAERAFSAFTHMVRDGREETNDFRIALSREPARIRDNWEPLWHYKSMGFYGAQLSRYFELFDRRQVRVYIYDDFVARPLEIVKDIFAFIGVGPNFVPDMSAKYNISLVPRSVLLRKLMTSENPIRSSFRNLLPKDMRRWVWRFVSERNLKRPPRLDLDIRRELTNAYREDIGLVESLINRDLSRWIKRASN